MRKLILLIAILSNMYCMPVFGQDDIEPKFETTTELTPNTTKKYTTTNLNIRRNPHLESEVIQTVRFGQELEIIENRIDGWSCIRLADGTIAYTKTEYLADVLPDNRWSIHLTEKEIDLLGRIVMLESGGESSEGQQAVIEVIFNRMIDPYYGGSLEHVLSARGQFSTWKNRNSSKAIPSDTVLQNISLVLNGKTNILPYQTLYFSRGAQNKRIQARIGDHVFCNK